MYSNKIPYVIKTEQHKIRQTLRKSMNVLSNEYSEHDEYKENYQALYHLPMVRNLRVENKRLKKEVRALNKKLARLLEKDVVDLRSEDEPDGACLKRKIKQEKNIKVKEEKSNIVYEIIEKEDGDMLRQLECELSAISLDDDEEVVLEEEEEAVLEEEEEEAVLEEEEAVLEEEEEEVVLEEEEEEVGLEEEEEEEAALEEDEEEEEEAVLEEEEEEAALEEAKETTELETIEEESEVFEIVIKGKTYYTNDDKNGTIYACDSNCDVGDEIGQFKNGKAIFQ
jgi:hypothetical protein